MRISCKIIFVFWVVSLFCAAAQEQKSPYEVPDVVTLELGKTKTEASLNYVTLVSDDIQATDIYGSDSDFFFVGISLSKSF